MKYFYIPAVITRTICVCALSAATLFTSSARGFDDLVLSDRDGVIYRLDRKTYPGSMCVRWAGTGTASYWYSAIGNPNGSYWLYIDCPVIRDDVDGTSEVAGAGIGVRDQHYSADISCNLNSIYLGTDGKLRGWWSPQQSSIGSGPGIQRINFSALPISNQEVYYYFSCRIPPSYAGNNSYIISYWLAEREWE